MSKPGRMFVFAALVLLAGGPSFAAEPKEPDGQQFLKQSGLEAIHGTYTKYFTLLADNKSEAAVELLIQSFPKNVDEETRRHMRELSAAISSVFARGVEDVELVGAQSVSSKCVALYYVLNGATGPTLVMLTPYRREGTWYTHSWSTSIDVHKIIDSLKGITRFSGNVVGRPKPPGRRA